MIAINTEAFKKAWFSFEEIQEIIDSEKEFEKTGVVYDLNEVQKLARKELFSKQEFYV